MGKNRKTGGKKGLKKILRDESGQSMVLLSLAFTVIMGCASLAADLEMAFLQIKNVIDIEDLVLLKVRWTNSSESGCEVSYLGEACNVSDIVNGTVKPDVPGNQASKGQGKLIR